MSQYSKTVRERLTAYWSEIGSKGGKAAGKSKRRDQNDPDYYRTISQRAAEARKRKARENK
jgi:general stress protein YciG